MPSTIPGVFLAIVSAASAGAQPVIAVFDSARQGAYAFGVPNSIVSQLHAAIVASFPDATFRELNTLTTSGLAGSDLVMLAVTYGGNQAIVPLSTDEQAALSAFVAGGGGAVIFCDNDTFSGAASDPANESLADPFGVDCTGTGAGGSQPATVIDPPASVVTDGPFGLVATFRVGWSGWFESFGSDMRRLANLDQNGNAVLLERPRLARQACGAGGGVVMFGDCTMLVNGYFTAQNSMLIRNAIERVRRGCGADFDSDGFVTGLDFDAFVEAFEAGEPCADFDSDGFITGLYFDAFVLAFEEGC